ncbi:MAG: hypothetical protein K8U03_26785 [Planctomycetia bacterium]|nr:hypothetical protein [Planctomycetia bacterium]
MAENDDFVTFGDCRISPRAIEACRTHHGIDSRKAVAELAHQALKTYDEHLKPKTAFQVERLLYDGDRVLFGIMISLEAGKLKVVLSDASEG